MPFFLLKHLSLSIITQLIELKTALVINQSSNSLRRSTAIPQAGPCVAAALAELDPVVCTGFREA